MTSTAQAEAAPVTAPPSFLRAVALIFTGWTILHLGLLALVLHGVAPGGWWLFLGLFGLILLPLAVVLRNFREHAYPSGWTRVLVMRPFFYVQLTFPFLTIALVLGALLGWPFVGLLAGARWGVGIMGAIVALAIVAGYVGSRALVVKRHAFAFPDLPPEFDGMTIAQLSDLHVGPHTSSRMLSRIVRAVEDAKPDLIAFTGDQVDDYDQDVVRFAEVFGHLRAPLGVYAIVGNHDIYAGWPGVRAGMEGAGMRVLVNDAEPIARGGSELWIACTGDPAGIQRGQALQPDAAPDIEKTIAKIPEGAFTVALAHNPALWPALAKHDVQLTLSGHTHHGQISIPFLNWCLASPFLEHAMGTHTIGSSRLYINPGTNYWGLPLRLGAWPEVTIITLKRA
jgi:predicted MPP superfamily phosphohydrolase